MITFEPRQPIKADDINANFAEASSGGYRSGAGQFGTSLPSGFQARPANEPLPAGCVYVRLDYPFRAPIGAVVGIDFPIREQTIEDSADVQSFLQGQTVYSCQKNQYRHHNGIGVLKQELKPGEIGIAVLSGVAKTFWHAQRPPYSADLGALSPDDTAANLPSESTNAAIDEYRQLATLSADYERTAFSEYGQDGSEHYVVTVVDEFRWLNRDRPWWFAPYPRLLSGDTAAEYELQYPYDPTGGNDINYVASSRGRAMGLSGYAVPEPSCTGTSTATCRNGHWTITATTCNVGCSSWHLIERNITASEVLGYGLMLPCTEDDEVTELPCGSDFPYVDYIDSPDETKHLTAPVGAWEGDVENDGVNNWIIGNAVLGTPESPGVVDAETATEGGRGNYWMPREFPSPYASISQSQWSVVLRACANLTCTYQCDGTEWQLVRGETPYNLDQHWRCKCPDDWMELMADHELPCGTATMPREFTVGMVYDSVLTTTSTTSSTTTTTGPCVDQCAYVCEQVFSGGVGVGYAWNYHDDCASQRAGCECPLPSIPLAPGGSIDPFGDSWPCSGPTTIDNVSCGDPPPPTGACCWQHAWPSCDYGCSIFTETFCNSIGGEYKGDDSDCSECTAPPTGACCRFDVGGAFEGCSITNECVCTNALWTWSGEGSTCDDCTSTTTSSTTTTTAPPTTTTTTTTSTTTTTTIPPTSTTTSSTTTTTADQGACCYILSGSELCTLTSESNCMTLGDSRTYLGPGTSCSSCPSTTSTTTSSTTTTSAGSSTTSSTTTTSTETTSSSTTTSDAGPNCTIGQCTYSCQWNGSGYSWQYVSDTCEMGCNCALTPPDTCTVAQSGNTTNHVCS